MNTWTPEEIDNIVKYGLCEVCGQPRELYRQRRNEHTISWYERMMLLCSADPGHDTHDVELTRYPRHENPPTDEDPTYGRIDRDIQWQVDHMLPETLGQRTAIEITLQEKRNRGLD